MNTIRGPIEVEIGEPIDACERCGDEAEYCRCALTVGAER